MCAVVIAVVHGLKEHDSKVNPGTSCPQAQKEIQTDNYIKDMVMAVLHE